MAGEGRSLVIFCNTLNPDFLMLIATVQPVLDIRSNNNKVGRKANL